MNKPAYTMGNLSKIWHGNGRILKTITFCVTEDCNLACKYCYMTGKNHNKKMTFEVAKKAVDYILSDKNNGSSTGVVWDFIGGEPFLEIDLIDRISDYIKQQMFLLDHPWFDAYRFSFSTNGLLYSSEKVQNYIKKNASHISIGVTIDGNKIKHDLQRVYPNGEGSYDDVFRNVKLWLEQFPKSDTKATFAHDDLPYLKDSIVNLWENGIKTIAANVVFEDVWQEGDDIILEEQLRELADYIIEKDLWRDHSVRFFDPSIGFPLAEEEKNINFCGAGKMLAIDCDGKFFPCIRFLDFSLNNREGRSIGDINEGINENRVRPFHGLTCKNQSKKECIECEVASGCAWCTGFNYDYADTDTIFQRSTYICKMHKATVKANEYFWDRFEQITGIISPRKEEKERRGRTDVKKYLQFILSDYITPHCSYRNRSAKKSVMSKEVFEKAMEFANREKYSPVFLQKDEKILGNKYAEELFIIDAKEENKPSNTIVIYDNNIDSIVRNANNCILLVSKYNVVNLYKWVNKIFEYNKRVNLVLEDIEGWKDSDLEGYKEQLSKISQLIIDKYEEKSLEINVLTDRLKLSSMCNCDAGTETFSVAPNGRIYLCPAFYFDNEENYIGDIYSGINLKNKHLMEPENAVICSACDAYQCSRCKYLNKKLTGEYNTPSKIQCLIAHVERNQSMELQKMLIDKKLIKKENIIPHIDYLDPLEKIIKEDGGAC